MNIEVKNIQFMLFIKLLHSQFMIMSKNYLLGDHEERVNPEFRGITEKYSHLRKQRQQLDAQRQSKERNMNYFERTKQSLDSKLKSKRQELKWLNSVRDRHLSDIRYKMEQEDRNNQKLEQLRLQSTNAKLTTRRNISEAVQNLKLEKLKTTQAVKHQLNQIKRTKQLQREEDELFYAHRSKQLQEQKSVGKSRVNKFYRRKNKLLLNSYRDMMKNQQMSTQKSQSQINFIDTKSSELTKQISKKKSKLKLIEQEIQKLKVEGSQSRIMPSGYNSIDFSRLTRKSSKTSPYDIIIKETFVTESDRKQTKAESKQ